MTDGEGESNTYMNGFIITADLHITLVSISICIIIAVGHVLNLLFLVAVIITMYRCLRHHVGFLVHYFLHNEILINPANNLCMMSYRTMVCCDKSAYIVLRVGDCITTTLCHVNANCLFFSWKRGPPIHGTLMNIWFIQTMPKLHQRKPDSMQPFEWKDCIDCLTRSRSKGQPTSILFNMCSGMESQRDVFLELLVVVGAMHRLHFTSNCGQVTAYHHPQTTTPMLEHHQMVVCRSRPRVPECKQHVPLFFCVTNKVVELN